MAMYIALIQECIGTRYFYSIISPRNSTHLEPKTTMYLGENLSKYTDNSGHWKIKKYTYGGQSAIHFTLPISVNRSQKTSKYTKLVFSLQNENTEC